MSGSSPSRNTSRASRSASRRSGTPEITQKVDDPEDFIRAERRRSRQKSATVVLPTPVGEFATSNTRFKKLEFKNKHAAFEHSPEKEEDRFLRFAEEERPDPNRPITPIEASELEDIIEEVEEPSSVTPTRKSFRITNDYSSQGEEEENASEATNPSVSTLKQVAAVAEEVPKVDSPKLQGLFQDLIAERRRRHHVPGGFTTDSSQSDTSDDEEYQSIIDIDEGKGKEKELNLSTANTRRSNEEATIADSISTAFPKGNTTPTKQSSSDNASSSRGARTLATPPASTAGPSKYIATTQVLVPVSLKRSRSARPDVMMVSTGQYNTIEVKFNEHVRIDQDFPGLVRICQDWPGLARICRESSGFNKTS